MPVNVNLMPAPAFEKSLVPAYQTNFSRIRDALLRTSNLTAIDSWESTGAWPKSTTIQHPFKCDVMVNFHGSCWTTAVGMSGLMVQYDGVTQGHWGTYFFNEINSHKHVGSSLIVRSTTPGAHTWTIAPIPGGNVGSDGNDYGTLGFTFIGVN